MSNTSTGTSSGWVPYKIPPTPTPEEGKKYFLSFSDDATPAKNPSKFLQWKEIGFPEGSNLGDILYWDPAAGDGGAWVVLAAPSTEGSLIYWDGSNWQFLNPPSGNALHVLGIRSRTLVWTATEDCD
jgi:hypothetical protein